MIKLPELSQIVGEILNIHSDPINDEKAYIELSMKEMLEIVNQCLEKENSRI